jgi:hypothetical protein
MAKKQTRRSVSIRGTTYDRIRHHCERTGVSMSEFVEEQIAAFFGGPLPVAPERLTPAPAPAPAAPKPMRAEKRKMSAAKGDEEKLSFDEMQDAARFFTF